MRITAILISGLLSGLIWPPAGAAQPQSPHVYHLVLEDHRFHPPEITIPAGTRVKLIIDNHQPVPALVVSFVLNRQKLVTAHHRILLYLPPMGAGTYTLFDDFHLSTKGTVTVK